MFVAYLGGGWISVFWGCLFKVRLQFSIICCAGVSFVVAPEVVSFMGGNA